MTAPPSTPPARPPSYFSGGWFRMGSDEPQFRVTGKFKFEFIDPDRGDDPALASASYAGELTNAIAREPLWRGEDWEIVPGQVTHEGDAHSVSFVARNQATGQSADGLIALSPDPSYWIKIEVHLGADPVFLAYMDRVWEEFELWPSGAAPENADVPPGRIGKRKTWISLEVAAWPQLAALTAEQYFSIEVPDL